MENQDRQQLWREVRAQCAMLGQYATLHAEDLRTAEGVRMHVVELLETLEALLTGALALEAEASEVSDPESLPGIVDRLQAPAADLQEAAAQREEARAHEICTGLIEAVFDVRRRQS